MNSQLNSLTMRPALAPRVAKPLGQHRPGTAEPRSAARVANPDGDQFIAGIVSLLDVRAPHTRHAR